MCGTQRSDATDIAHRHIKAAAHDAKTGKYVKEVFIAYGKTEEEAEKWLNDTGMPLGELLMKQTRREIGEENYDGLSKNDKLQHGDFQQIMLESNSMAISTMEQALTLGADIDETTWLALRS